MASSTGRMQRRTSRAAPDGRRPANEKFLDRAHAAPYVGAVTLTGNDTRTLNEKFLLFDRAHAAPFAGPAVTPLPSATSGTFHPGKVADDQLSATSGTFPGKVADDQVMAPAKRARRRHGSHTVNVAKRGPDAYPRPSFRFRPSSREATMRGSS